MAGFVVSDLLDAIVRGCGEAGRGKEAGVEELDALLVEAVDGPLGSE